MNCLGRAMKDRHEAVSECLNFAALELGKLLPHCRVVMFEEIAPPLVSQRRGQLSRVDDVGEQNCGQDPACSRLKQVFGLPAVRF